MTYFFTLLTIFSIWAIGAVALNLIVGYAGQLSVTHGAFMGVGAYAFSLTALRLGVDPLLAIVIAVIFGAVFGGAFTLTSLRLAGFDYVLISLMLQSFVVLILGRWVELTGGVSGLAGVPRPEIFGLSLRDPAAFAVFALVVAAITVTLFWFLGRSQYALALRGFRESERSIASLGFSPNYLRITVGALAGAGAGLSGSLYASFLGYISPAQFAAHLSVLVLIYILVGGTGNMLGAVLGVAIVMTIPEVVNNLTFVPSRLLGPVAQIGYGLVIMIFVFFRRQGVSPERPILLLSPDSHPTLLRRIQQLANRERANR